MFTKKRNFLIFSILLIMIMFIFAVPWASASAVGLPPPAAEAVPPAFNLLEFLEMAGLFYLPTLAIVFGVVDYLGKWGVKGKWQLASSLIAGLILGGLVMYFTTYPATPVAWFSVALYGLLVGLGASGCYNGIKTASAKGAKSAGGITDPPQ